MGLARSGTLCRFAVRGCVGGWAESARGVPDLGEVLVVSEPEVVWVGDQWVPVRAEGVEPTKGVGGVGKRDRVVAVRLFADELEAWKAAAVGDGRREVGRWVRELVAGVVEGRPLASPVGPANGVSRVELARIGNNLNQAMRFANTQPLDSGARDALIHAVVATQHELRALREGSL